MKALACLALLLPLAAHAGMYRWVDAKGAVHYTQTPPPPGISGSAVAPAAPPAQVNPQLNRLSSFGQQVDKNLKQRAQAQQKSEEVAQERESNCSRARGRLALQTDYAGRIFHSDDKGNRQFQSAEENAQVREQLQQQINENCD